MQGITNFPFEVKAVYEAIVRQMPDDRFDGLQRFGKRRFVQ
jgi:hypothetical protein